VHVILTCVIHLFLTFNYWFLVCALQLLAPLCKCFQLLVSLWHKWGSMLCNFTSLSLSSFYHRELDKCFTFPLIAKHFISNIFVCAHHIVCWLCYYCLKVLALTIDLLYLWSFVIIIYEPL
jgi:hypothetical protein